MTDSQSFPERSPRGADGSFGKTVPVKLPGADDPPTAAPDASDEPPVSDAETLPKRGEKTTTGGPTLSHNANSAGTTPRGTDLGTNLPTTNLGAASDVKQPEQKDSRPSAADRTMDLNHIEPAGPAADAHPTQRLGMNPPADSVPPADTPESRYPTETIDLISSPVDDFAASQPSPESRFPTQTMFLGNDPPSADPDHESRGANPNPTRVISADRDEASHEPLPSDPATLSLDCKKAVEDKPDALSRLEQRTSQTEPLGSSEPPASGAAEQPNPLRTMVLNAQPNAAAESGNPATQSLSPVRRATLDSEPGAATVPLDGAKLNGPNSSDAEMASPTRTEVLAERNEESGNRTENETPTVVLGADSPCPATPQRPVDGIPPPRPGTLGDAPAWPPASLQPGRHKNADPPRHEDRVADHRQKRDERERLIRGTTIALLATVVAVVITVICAGLSTAVQSPTYAASIIAMVVAVAAFWRYSRLLRRLRRT